MFNNNFEYEVLKKKRDLNGNYLALDVVIDKPKLTLLSLYGPNMDNPDFYDQSMNTIEDFFFLQVYRCKSGKSSLKGSTREH
jgi:hypothetical protein